MAIRTANARWEGTFSDGTGIMRTGKGGLEANFSAKSRFEEGEGSNPEELIGAALAGCFSMALAKALTDGGFPPTSVETTANVHLDRVDGKATVTRIHLVSTSTVPNIEQAEFAKHAEATKAGCPISRLLSPGTEITLEASVTA